MPRYGAALSLTLLLASPLPALAQPAPRPLPPISEVQVVIGPPHRTQGCGRFGRSTNDSLRRAALTKSAKISAVTMNRATAPASNKLTVGAPPGSR